jgi:uncharacterized protein YdaU (DUF1376 family)
MGTLKWYKRDHNAALAGMLILTLEERGAYNTVLDLIYANDGAIPDRPTSVCKWLGTNARRWKRIRARLITARKIYVLGGNLRNERADREIAIAIRKAIARRSRRFHVVK